MVFCLVKQKTDYEVRIILGGLFFFKQKTACEIRLSLVGSEMCIRDGVWVVWF